MRNIVMRIKFRIACAAIVGGLVLANGAVLAASVENGKIAYVKKEVDVVKPLVEGPAIPILLS